MSYSKLRDNQGEPVPLSLTSQLHISETQLDWRFTLRNTGEKPVEILELDIPLPMDQYFRKDDLPQIRTVCHAAQLYCGSFLLCLLVLNPAGTAQCCLWPLSDGTRLEAFREDRNTAIHHLDEVARRFWWALLCLPNRKGRGASPGENVLSYLGNRRGKELLFPLRIPTRRGGYQPPLPAAQWGLLAMEPVPRMVLPRAGDSQAPGATAAERITGYSLPAHTNDAKVLSVRAKGRGVGGNRSVF